MTQISSYHHLSITHPRRFARIIASFSWSTDVRVLSLLLKCSDFRNIHQHPWYLIVLTLLRCFLMFGFHKIVKPPLYDSKLLIQIHLQVASAFSWLLLVSSALLMHCWTISKFLHSSESLLGFADILASQLLVMLLHHSLPLSVVC